MSLHALEPTRASLHGHFSRDLPPALVIDPGDTVRFRLLDAGWGLEPHDPATGQRRRFEPRDRRLDGGHALCGPIEIRGAEAGMELEVGIGEIRAGAWGWTSAGGWPSPLNRRLGVAEGKEHLLVWSLDAARGEARDQHGRTVPMRPFLGVIGMPPDAPGIHSTFPPRPSGGNLDCKELVPGSRLFLPIAVRGARVSAGDGHAAQGDGEASGLGIECPIERADLTFLLHPSTELPLPRAETPAGWITFGFDESLDEAAASALDAMLRWLEKSHGLERRDALALASVAVDLRVTQLVNGARGVHALLVPGAIGPAPPSASPSR